MAAAELTKKTIAELAAGFRAREFSAKEATAAYLGAIKQKNPETNAYLEVYEDALEAAEAADQNGFDGQTHALAGIPLAVKDNILVQRQRSTAGSNILAPYVSGYDATAISKLKRAGAVFLGKTNLDEFAMGSSTEHSAFGPAKNPYDPERVPGGSSGGSAAAVAGRLAAGALGSDTGGSIRQPASFCGVVGMKPTYGRVSRSGLVAMASSLDQIGPIARTVADAELIFGAISGRDPLDSTTADGPAPRRARGLKGARIGLPKEYFQSGLDKDVALAVENAVRQCRALGATVSEIELPHAPYALAAYYIIMPAEASSNLARFDGIRYGFSAPAETLDGLYRESRARGFGSESKRRIILGTFVLSHGYYDAYYRKAQRVRELIRRDFESAFRNADFIMGPTAPTPAFRIGEKSADPLEMYLADIYTVAVNLAGLPALSLPAGTVEREGAPLPVGVQIIAPWFEESSLFKAAGELEGALPGIPAPAF